MPDKWCLSCAMAAAIAATSIGSLLALPGRSSQHARFDKSELAEAQDRAGRFSLGPLTWDLNLYESAPTLQPLRDYFRAHCGSEKGLEAARCLSSGFLAAVPWGSPRHEFVDAFYDPAADLSIHLAGEPGHCVTRSGLITAILLSVSVPARQVQLSMGALGHNIFEVWDSRWGWVVVDPSFVQFAVGPDGEPESIAAYVSHRPQWRSFGTPLTGGYFYEEIDRRIRQGEIADITFPDPWLYTRVGRRAATWPFRGLFAHTGGFHFWWGPAQQGLRWSAALGLVLSVVCGLGGRRRKSPAQRLGSTIR